MNLSEQMLVSSPSTDPKDIPSGSYTSEFCPYPSPPATNVKQTVPLPTLHFYAARETGGILDSPLFMYHDVLTTHAPISPPPTIPTPTLELPQADGVTCVGSESREYSSSLLGATPSTPGEAQQLLSPLSPEWESHDIPSDVAIQPPIRKSALLYEH